MFETDDSFYAVLCLRKADNFAIPGKPEVTTHTTLLLPSRPSNRCCAAVPSHSVRSSLPLFARVQETPIWVCTKKDRVVDVLKARAQRIDNVSTHCDGCVTQRSRSHLRGTVVACTYSCIFRV